MLGRPLRRRLSECPRCKSRLSYVSRARHLSACLFHVSASGAIIAAATANSRRLSQQNPYKTCVSLVELGRNSRHFIVHFKKIPTKIILRYGRCAADAQRVGLSSSMGFRCILRRFSGTYVSHLRAGILRVDPGPAPIATYILIFNTRITSL